MGRPITDRRTGSVGGLCDSLRPEQAFAEGRLRCPLVPRSRAVAPAPLGRSAANCWGGEGQAGSSRRRSCPTSASRRWSAEPCRVGAARPSRPAAVAGAESVGGPEMPERAGDLAAGVALLIGGAVSWTRRPRAGAGRLMVDRPRLVRRRSLERAALRVSGPARAPASHVSERPHVVARHAAGDRRGMTFGRRTLGRPRVPGCNSRSGPLGRPMPHCPVPATARCNPCGWQEVPAE